MKVKVITRPLADNTYGQKFEIEENLFNVKPIAVSSSTYVFNNTPMIAITILTE